MVAPSLGIPSPESSSWPVVLHLSGGFKKLNFSSGLSLLSVFLNIIFNGFIILWYLHIVFIFCC